MHAEDQAGDSVVSNDEAMLAAGRTKSASPAHLGNLLWQ
jgi:hypothetical protein